MRVTVQLVLPHGGKPVVYTVCETAEKSRPEDVVLNLAELLGDIRRNLLAQIDGAGEALVEDGGLLGELRTLMADPDAEPMATQCTPVLDRHRAGCPHVDWTKPVHVVSPLAWASMHHGWPDGAAPGSITAEALSGSVSSGESGLMKLPPLPAYVRDSTVCNPLVGYHATPHRGCVSVDRA